MTSSYSAPMWQLQDQRLAQRAPRPMHLPKILDRRPQVLSVKALRKRDFLMGFHPISKDPSLKRAKRTTRHSMEKTGTYFITWLGCLSSFDSRRQHSRIRGAGLGNPCTREWRLVGCIRLKFQSTAKNPSFVLHLPGSRVSHSHSLSRNVAYFPITSTSILN